MPSHLQEAERKKPEREGGQPAGERTHHWKQQQSPLLIYDIPLQARSFGTKMKSLSLSCGGSEPSLSARQAASACPGIFQVQASPALGGGAVEIGQAELEAPIPLTEWREA